MRSVGAQLPSTVMYLTAFYIIGAPIGVCLMFLTDLQVRGANLFNNIIEINLNNSTNFKYFKGFLIGVLVGLVVLNIFQIIYVSRLNWEKKAKEVIYNTKLDKKCL